MNEDERIRRAFLRAFAKVRNASPYKTGNLRVFGVSSRSSAGRGFEIYVNVQKAPYMKYTNEPWHKFGPPLRGKENPNEGWWGRAARAAVRSLAIDLKGVIQ